MTSFKDRAAGAILGAFIGDALGLGPHWYYDLDELRRDYGYVTGYVDPKPDRYHGGMKGGELSQSGIILAMLADSTIERGGYDEADFCRKLDEELFPKLDGTPRSGPGGYTSQSIREAWRKRVKEGAAWGETGGHADNTEAIERTIALAARYARNPSRAAESISANTVLTQVDETIVAITTAFGLVLSLLVQGRRLDSQISDELMRLVKSGALPFHTVTTGKLQAPATGAVEKPVAGNFSSPDALLTPAFIAEAAADPEIRIEPAWKVSLVYGMPCAVYHIVPAAYYLAARFSNDFESAVLNAVNGGGQNQARAMLAGALVGAQVGVQGIPQRFIDGLVERERLVALAARLAADAEHGATAE